MRISSSLALLTFTISFLSVLMPTSMVCPTPVNSIEECPEVSYAITWIDLHESPPLWILLATTLIVAMHDMKWFEGIKFIRRSDNRVFRAFLILIAIGMTFAMELSVNVALTANTEFRGTYWDQSILFKMPDVYLISNFVKIAYYLIRLCRLILVFTFFVAILEKSLRVKLSSLKIKELLPKHEKK